MKSAALKKRPAKPTGRRFASVTELMRAEGVSSEVQAKFKEIAQETRVVCQLMALRHLAGLTQADLAARLGVSQSAVSKLESGRDEDLTLGQIKEYARSIGERIGVIFEKPPIHSESVLKRKKHKVPDFGDFEVRLEILQSPSTHKRGFSMARGTVPELAVSV